MEIFAFVIFLAIFTAIGILSSKRNSSQNADNDLDYLLAGRDVSPLLTALSAAATKYSGYMFIALMGYIYTYGLSAIWLIFGFLFGDLVAFYFVHAKVREQAEKSNAMSFADLISRWHGGDYRILRAAIGIISLVFLATYAAAQFNAGGKALYVLFGWHYNVGIIIGAGLILSYCLTGGLRASIWTDAAQSVVMISALIILLVASVNAAGGIGDFTTNLQAVSPNYMGLGVERFGSLGATALFAFGWLFNGLGVTGQPHIMIRFMVLDQPKNMLRTGVYYFTWSSCFLALVLAVGLATRLYITNMANFDPELALPMLAKQLLPNIALGVIMGGIFAAIMSTTDSQILNCSAVLSEDFKLAKGRHAKWMITLGVTLVALSISLFAGASVFTLVILAWSALSSTIGPLVLVHALGKRPPEWLALVMMASGLITVLAWRYVGLNVQVYEALPGMLVPGVVYAVGSLFTAKASANNFAPTKEI
ncbi:MAG: sodium/proline symporter [Alteromonadaceae bacterium]|jgi:sodium/proline symporter